MKKVIASAGLFALGAVGVQNVQAQWVGPEKPWTISGTLRGFYDDNINTQPDGPGRVSSWGFEVRPSGGIDLEYGPTSLKASYTYALLYYTEREPNKYDQNHDFELTFNHNFSERYSVNATESFVVAQEPDVIAPGTQSLLLRANGNNLRNSAAINFNVGVTRLLSFVLGYANTYYDYSENAGNTVVFGSVPYSTLLNRLEQAVTLDSHWQVREDTSAVLGYKFGWVNYSGGGSILANGNISPAVNNNYSHYVYVGADELFRSDLTGSVRVGIQDVQYYQTLPGNASSQLSPYAQISLAYRYMDGGSLVFGFQNSRNQTDIPATLNTGTGQVQLTQDQQSATVYLNVIQQLTPISPRLTATLTGQYQNSTYKGGFVNNYTDNVYTLGLNLAYQFNHYFSAEIGYNFDDVKSQVPGLEYSRNRVYMGVTASY